MVAALSPKNFATGSPEEEEEEEEELTQDLTQDHFYRTHKIPYYLWHFCNAIA